MSSLVQEKVAQAVAILREQGVACWLTFVRESSAAGDPVLPLIYGHDLTWPSALLLFANGRRVAIVGRYDADTAQATGAYDEVIAYDQSIQPALLRLLHEHDPAQIALNYSLDDVTADGLTHGMFLLLQRYLAETPFAARLQSAAAVVGALRSRKVASEIERIQAAIAITLDIYAQSFAWVQPGVTERQIDEFMKAQAAARGVALAWDPNACPIVNAGPESTVGHAAPSALVLQRGHLLHLDFGIRQDDYCSDIQRVAYVLREGETEPPPEVQRGFATVVQAIRAAVAAMRPGVTGQQIDQIARDVVVGAGYPEYLYATGHHLGRTVHDGAGLLGPLWERYGETPHRPLEAGHVYTVEPGLRVPGYGYIGIEEDVLVTEQGAHFLGTPQTTLTLIS